MVFGSFENSKPAYRIGSGTAFIRVLIPGALLLGTMVWASCATNPEMDPDLGGQSQIRSIMADETAGGAEFRFPFSVRYVEDPIIHRETFQSPVSDILPALVHAFAQEGLDPDWVDPDRRIVGLTQFTMERRWGTRPMSAFLDCGFTTTGRTLANDAKITAGIVSQVVGTGPGESTVLVRFEAFAQPFGASAGRTQNCTTTGELEQAIFLRLRFR